MSSLSDNVQPEKKVLYGWVALDKPFFSYLQRVIIIAEEGTVKVCKEVCSKDNLNLSFLLLG